MKPLKINTEGRKRILIVFVLFLIFFVAVGAKLFYIQVIRKDELSEMQSNQVTSTSEIVAERGNIYDVNMSPLVQDASSSSINVIPEYVSDKRELADYLATMLDMDADEIYSTITDPDTENQSIEIASKVDNDIAQEILAEDYTGIEIYQDQKRYYTQGDFASYVLGFTGIDHQGLYGIESTFDSELSGTSGLLLFQHDVNNQKIISDTSVVYPEENGNDIVLTLDNYVQYVLEKELEEGVEETGATKGIAIVMEIETGNVMAMATSPSYNLNDPYTITEEFSINNASALEGLSLGEQQLLMWQNPAVSFIYEPGSTFKLVTTAAVLEEGEMNIDTQLECPGYITVNGVTIRDYFYPDSIGVVPLHTAVARSSNSGLVQMLQTVDSDVFYDYVYSLGFGDTTGIQLDGEESGIFPYYEDINMVDYATYSFGQGIAVTPIQLITALSGLMNDGHLMQANLLDKIIDGETDEVIYEQEPVELNQVISQETSENLRTITKEVISLDDSLSALCEGYDIGGKTGTAQKLNDDGTYSTSKFVCSFFCVAPTEDPEYAILVVMDEPTKGALFGSTTAAPVAIEVMKTILDNQTAESLETAGENTEETVDTVVYMPDLIGQHTTVAENILNKLGISYTFELEDTDGYITEQSISAGTYYTEDQEVVLTITEEEPDEEKVRVPDVEGMSVTTANELLEGMGLTMSFEGSGYAVSQSPAAGTKVEKGTEITVEFENVSP
jgi:stage V sporulation protein D (sporulation-specific penicillin-binding protein)